ncbi:LPS export ABC transporter periplasmic protein LptC [Echinicola sp. 20G]|uniref:LPS export ABC transporter periplasmic protein LptC n=1 Tax=Echinicola sp. 20G TaxID=2781961 RepID=UPI00190FF03A|nr:LPS export ABC transporter periplasmic protein LptC [Echinicola sp. 20G]
MKRVAFIFLVIVMAASCRESVDLRQLENYDGPVRVTTAMEVFRSDSAVVRIKMTAPRQLVFSNNDMEFPEGILIHFYETDGVLSSTIRADRAYYDHKENLYRGEGDVRVHNIEKGNKLNSEELFWDERKGIIFTEKFVTVTKKNGTVIHGTGMEADESFNEYTFYKIVDSPIVIEEGPSNTEN